MEMITGGDCKSSQQKQKQSEQDAALEDSLRKIKQIFMVMSGKGGVGKTSVSVNLAMALAKKGFKVGIMDVDIHGPDVPRMLGIQKEMLGVNANRKLTPLAYSDNLSAVSIESLSASKDDAIIWRGPMKHSVIRQFISDVEWGELDYLIIDSPPGTGDEPLSVAQTISGAKAIIVTTPQEVSLADVRKSINFCQTIKMEIFGLIENMSGFKCPHCGEAIDMFGTGGGEKTASDFGIHFLGRIPFEPKIVACGDSGSCYQEIYKTSPVTLAFEAVAERMAKLNG
ncbi:MULTISPECIES: Mrp/NBP35 family ATP-binding protein [Desulfococcus]|uniref:Iron-sulfur cluster carrier protein n=1 Tax=Desulfococcus multivorans DSM 2059 TaxID=1121405 RepID=S7U6W1_DESML|nr:Mrp/NBP35 family ATP-binding protein [Desulfococcus multivorans]AOY58869.1 putative ATP-binding protein, ParA family [Desulfococcus multivorans]AQV01153.1 ATP-binding protein [Desulfococcus multivorans]EPR44845.1 ATPase-like, ParA/MinD [Desulfococcus multivorans DSM 2059]SJZ52164.1 Chromosome partitioning ATPase, Mrp family, contains Fe-S cluster [Desulfococcus multivorans DSM 2059]